MTYWLSVSYLPAVLAPTSTRTGHRRAGAGARSGGQADAAARLDDNARPRTAPTSTTTFSTTAQRACATHRRRGGGSCRPARGRGRVSPCASQALRMTADYWPLYWRSTSCSAPTPIARSTAGARCSSPRSWRAALCRDALGPGGTRPPSARRARSSRRRAHHRSRRRPRAPGRFFWPARLVGLLFLLGRAGAPPARTSCLRLPARLRALFGLLLAAWAPEVSLQDIWLAEAAFSGQTTEKGATTRARNKVEFRFRPSSTHRNWRRLSVVAQIADCGGHRGSRGPRWRCNSSQSIELGRLGKAFQQVRSERHDEGRIEQARKPLRHQKRLTGDTADPLQSADENDVWTDQREIESMAVADVSVVYLAMMERNAGVKLGVGYGKLL